MYKITIEKQVENPNYEEEIKTFNEATRYERSSYQNSMKPSKTFSQVILTTELTQAEWEAVKKSIISVK